MTSKQPLRSNLKSDLKFMAQITYATMFVWTVLTFFELCEKERRKKDNSPLLELLGFAATKNVAFSLEKESAQIPDRTKNVVHTIDRELLMCAKCLRRQGKKSAFALSQTLLRRTESWCLWLYND